MDKEALNQQAHSMAGAGKSDRRPPPPPPQSARPIKPLRSNSSLASAAGSGASDDLTKDYGTSGSRTSAGAPLLAVGSSESVVIPLQRQSSQRVRPQSVFTAEQATQIISTVHWSRLLSMASIIKAVTLSFTPLTEKPFNIDLTSAAHIPLAAAIYFALNWTFDVVLMRALALCYCIKVNGRRQSLAQTQSTTASCKGSIRSATLETLDVLPILVGEEAINFMNARYLPAVAISMPIASTLLVLGWGRLVKTDTESSKLLDSLLRFTINTGLLCYELFLSPLLDNQLGNKLYAALSSCAITLLFTAIVTPSIKRLEETQCLERLQTCANLLWNKAHKPEPKAENVPLMPRSDSQKTLVAP